MLDDHDVMNMDGMASDEDVFGHGGDLDEQPPLDPPSDDSLQPRRTQVDHGDEEGRADVAIMRGLKGATMHMLLSTLMRTPERHPMDHVVPVFNSATGKIVSAPLRSIEAEVKRLRDMGVRDTEDHPSATTARCEDSEPRADGIRAPQPTRSKHGLDNARGGSR
jgi:hypothetical protein